MRHLLSVLLSLVLAPLVYAAAGFSAVKLAGDATEVANLAVAPVIIGLAAAVVAGGGYAVLVMARLSPVGPVLAGLAFLGVTLWALFARGSFAETMPADILGAQDALHTPVGAGTMLLAVPLLVTVASARRWRESAEPAAGPFSAAPEYGSPPGSAAPTYDEPATTASFQTPIYRPESSGQP